MSPREWRQCPKCKQVDDAARAAAQTALEASYGVATAAEYLKERDRIAKWPALENTCRVNFEQHFENGVFKHWITYACDKCNFKFEYEIEIPVPELQ